MRSKGTLVRSRMAWRRSTKRTREDGKISTPAAQIDAAQHQFLVAVGDQLIDVLQDFCERQRAAAPAHVGDHAERAAVVASVLHLEVGSGLLVVGIKYRRGQQFGVCKDIVHHDRRPANGGLALTNQGIHGNKRAQRDQIRRHCIGRNRIRRDQPAGGGQFAEAMLVRVAHHQRDAVDGGDFLGGALRIASGNQDAGSGVQAMNAPDGRTRVVIGRRGDRTGVQHHDLGLGRGGGTRQSLIGQLAFNGCAIGLGGAAPEVFYIETAHGSIISALGVGAAPFSIRAAAPMMKAFCSVPLRPVRTVTGRLPPDGSVSAVGSWLCKRFWRWQ